MKTTTKWKKEPVTVEQIHNDFETVTNFDILRTRIIKHIEDNSSSDEEIKLVNKYRAAGFYSSKHIKTENTKQSLKKQGLEDLTKHDELKLKYPHLKYISHNDVLKLCTKYGLVISVLSDYIKDIPENILDEILNFKIDRHHKSILRKMYGSGYQADTISSIQSTNNDSAGTKYLIVAPRSHFKHDVEFDTSGQAVHKPVSDPIVLCPVYTGGYFIVAKWGDEALLPEVQESAKN